MVDKPKIHFDDSLVGTNSSNVLCAVNGSDRLFGLASDDKLLGNNRDNVLVGGAGNDSLYRMA